MSVSPVYLSYTFKVAKSVVIMVLVGKISNQEWLYYTPTLRCIIFSLLQGGKYRELAFPNIGQSSEQREWENDGKRCASLVLHT